MHAQTAAFSSKERRAWTSFTAISSCSTGVIQHLTGNKMSRNSARLLFQNGPMSPQMALDLLKWNRDETRFVLAGRLLVAEQPTSGRGVRFAAVHGLLAVLGRPNSNYRPDLAHDNSLLFPRNTGIRDGALLLAKEKAGKFVLPREPLSLGSCIISCDPELKDCFEIQEYTSKEGFLFKAENSMETREWLKQLRYHAKDLGSWRRRRNGMANIMINGMDRY